MASMTNPPVRYSVSMPSYHPTVGQRLKVSLNGEEQEAVLGYDTESGILVRYKTDEQGNLMINDRGDEALRETVEGNVTVEWRE